MEVSAGIMVKDSLESEEKYLCVRAYSNWDFPKGLVEAGESLGQAATRELMEETSLGTGDIKMVGLLAPPVTYKGGKKTAHYFLADRISQKTPFLPVSPELGKPENDEYAWLTLGEMRTIFPARLLPVLGWLESV